MKRTTRWDDNWRQCHKRRVTFPKLYFLISKSSRCQWHGRSCSYRHDYGGQRSPLRDSWEWHEERRKKTRQQRRIFLYSEDSWSSYNDMEVQRAKERPLVSSCCFSPRERVRVRVCWSHQPTRGMSTQADSYSCKGPSGSHSTSIQSIWGHIRGRLLDYQRKWL